MPQANPQISLGRNASVLLDVVRFAAALAVLLAHLVFFSTRTGMIPDEIGNQSVCVFFVLSGFVIRFVSESRESTLRAYLIDRAARIYSVVLPALVFTVVAEGVCVLFFPSGYGVIGKSHAWHNVVPHLLTSVTFTFGYWDYGETPLSNGALWSLSFEVVYYILYGLLRYTKSLRWVLVPLILLLVGPSISALFLVWLLGALLFDGFVSLRRKANGVSVAAVIFFVVMTTLLALRHPIMHLIKAFNSTARVTIVSRYVASTALGQRWFHGAEIAWLSRLSVSFFFVGLALSAVLLLLMVVLERKVKEVSPGMTRAVRYVADSTFALYCFHTPMMVLIFSVDGHKATTWWGTIAATVGTIAFSIAIARPLDSLKVRMRGWLRGWFRPRMREA